MFLVTGRMEYHLDTDLRTYYNDNDLLVKVYLRPTKLKTTSSCRSWRVGSQVRRTESDEITDTASLRSSTPLHWSATPRPAPD